MNMRYTDISNGTMSSKFLRTVARSLRTAIEAAEEEGRYSYAQTLRIRVHYIEHELRARSRGVADHLRGQPDGSFWDSPLASRICGVPWQPKEVIGSESFQTNLQGPLPAADVIAGDVAKSPEERPQQFDPHHEIGTESAVKAAKVVALFARAEQLLSRRRARKD